MHCWFNVWEQERQEEAKNAGESFVPASVIKNKILFVIQEKSHTVGSNPNLAAITFYSCI